MKKKATEDEFDDFLDDCGIEKPTQVAIKPLNYEVTAVNSEGGECFPLFIGGSELASGWTEHRLASKSCAKLRCKQCDKKIVRFDHDVRWSAKVDYIFVRNYNTYPEKLKQGLEKAKGFASYAC